MQQRKPGSVWVSAALTFAALMGVSATVFPAEPAATPPAATPPAPPPAAATPAAAAANAAESGLAAVYSEKLNGHRTASGQVYNPAKLTAAHKTLPFGTKVKVTNTKNGKSVVVRINDRGPKQAGRILDLSPSAARALGIRHHAMAEVSIEIQS